MIFPLVFIREGSKAWVNKYGVLTFKFKCKSSKASSVSINGLNYPIPALWISTSICGVSDIICWLIVGILWRLDKSAEMI